MFPSRSLQPQNEKSRFSHTGRPPLKVGPERARRTFSRPGILLSPHAQPSQILLQLLQPLHVNGFHA